MTKLDHAPSTTSTGTSGPGRGRSRVWVTGTFIVLVVLAVAGYALKDKIADLLPKTGNPPVVIGDDPEYQFRTGSDGESKVRQCNGTAVVKEKRCCPAQPVAGQQCDDIAIVVIDALLMPFIARNITEAWKEGRPSILHKEGEQTDEKRAEVCGRANFRSVHIGGSCDEFPFASSAEGGAAGSARTEEVQLSENRCQGGTISQAYRRYKVQEGEQYIVVITHPDNTAPAAWDGTPKEAASC